MDDFYSGFHVAMQRALAVTVLLLVLCAAFFIIAIVICAGVNQRRGQRVAGEWEARLDDTH